MGNFLQGLAIASEGLNQASETLFKAKEKKIELEEKMRQAKLDNQLKKLQIEKAKYDVDPETLRRERETADAEFNIKKNTIKMFQPQFDKAWSDAASAKINQENLFDQNLQETTARELALERDQQVIDKGKADARETERLGAARIAYDNDRDTILQMKRQLKGLPAKDRPAQEAKIRAREDEVISKYGPDFGESVKLGDPEGTASLAQKQREDAEQAKIDHSNASLAGRKNFKKNKDMMQAEEAFLAAGGKADDVDEFYESMETMTQGLTSDEWKQIAINSLKANQRDGSSPQALITIFNTMVKDYPGKGLSQNRKEILGSVGVVE